MCFECYLMLCYFVRLCYIILAWCKPVKTCFFQTVPFDLTGVHPSPRQAKAMVGSNLLSPLFLLLLFFFSSSFLLQTPPHLMLNHCHLSHSVSHLLNILVQVQHPGYQHLQTQTHPLPTHPPAVAALPPSKGPRTSLSKHFPLFRRLCMYFFFQGHMEPSKKVTRLFHKVNLPFFPPIFFPEFPPPHSLVSCGRILLWHGLSVTVISLWCSNMWEDGRFSSKVLMY